MRGRMDDSELTGYMSRTVKAIIANVLKNTIHNPKETAFLLKYKAAADKAADKRLKLE